MSAARNRPRGSGFTLVELMIVVAIVGILAVLATYGVRKYIANAKTAEARNTLGQIAKDAALAYERETVPTVAGQKVLNQRTSTAVLRSLCVGAAASIPSSAGAIRAKKYQSKSAEWNAGSASNTGFACLKFEMTEPQYFMYSYTNSGTANIGDSFTASAQGDLDGDQTLSLFQVTGQIGAGHVVNIAPTILEVRPED